MPRSTPRSTSPVTRSPFVAVIMPAYNAEKYIRKSIDSILHQTYQNLELIIIDDGSQDNTANIIQSYKDPRIQYYKNKKNSKEWFSRQVGLQQALNNNKVDYIAWQDADDMAAPTRIEKQLSFLQQHKKINLVATDMIIIDDHEQKIKTVSNTAANAALHRQRLFCPTMMFDKKILTALPMPFFRPLPIGTDIDFLYRVMEKNWAAGSIPQPLYHYRRSSEQTTAFHLLSLLYGELVRYSAYSRRLLGSDLLPISDDQLLTSKDLPRAFAPFIKQKKLSNIHKIFIRRFVIGQLYAIIKNPILLFRHSQILFSIYFLLWRYQPWLSIIHGFYALPRNIVSFIYCLANKKDFFVE